MPSSNGVHNSRLDIVVVGAGPAGLASAWRLATTGHHVTVVERKQELNMGGGDIQCAPNAVRALRQIGLESKLQHVADPHKWSIYRSWHSIKPMGKLPVDLSGEYHSLMFRRDDLIQALYEAAANAGVKLLFGRAVAVVDEHVPSVKLEDGDEIIADVVIGADGVKSTIRTLLFPERDTRPIRTDQVCFHANIPYELMKQEPETLALWNDGDAVDLVFDPDRYLTMWKLETRKEYFIITSEANHDESADITSWETSSKHIDAMIRPYQDWPPAIRKAMATATQAAKWRIVDGVAGADWISSSGKVVLIGDAIHAMPPHAAQGFSQGIEDAAALGELLGAVKSRDDILRLLKAFAELRRPRAEKVQQCSRNNLTLATLPDGPYQQARDKFFSGQKFDEDAVDAWKALPADATADFSDPRFLKWLQTYDVVAMARNKLKEEGLM